MNNSKFAIESVSLELEEPQINIDVLRKREQKLVRIIESLRDVQKTDAWSSLKEDVFDSLPVNLNKQILLEAKKQNPDTNKLNRLSGELKWAEGFSDLHKLEESFKVELTNSRKILYGKT